MLIRCVGNSLDHLYSMREREAYRKNIHQEKVDLKIGEVYTVYGIFFSEDAIPWFLLCPREDDEYPTPQLGAFFEIVDGKIPSGWMFTTVSNNVGSASILPKGWADDPNFLEKLVDGDEGSRSYFRQMKVDSNRQSFR